MSAHLETLASGLLCTIQDLGRVGSQALGMPVAGALDPRALRIANTLVGNPEGMAALEIRISGPTFRVVADSVRIALVGTAAPITILAPSRRSVPSMRSVRLSRGAEFRIGAIPDSACCYLAVEGGFDVPSVYGSQSTYLRGEIGGFEGRALREGDRIPLNSGSASPGPDNAATLPLEPDSNGPIRVVLGPQANYFSKAGIETFLGSPYSVTRDADRMGLRLDGPVIEHELGFNITSDGIVTGSIQVPGTGLPIVLLVDHQTTGGYPKIGTVISADLPRLGRMRPSTVLTFKAVEVAEAERLRRAQEDRVRRVVDTILPIPGSERPSNHRLRSVNLIDGVIAEPLDA